MGRSGTTILVGLCLAAQLAWAQAPPKLGYQGRLFLSDGTPATGLVTLGFAVYGEESGGTPLWSEEQVLALSRGYYATALGQVVALPPGVFDGGERWLELALDGEALVPRQRVASVPYALRAEGARNVHGGTVEAGAASVSGAVSAGSLQVGGTTRLGAGGYAFSALKKLDYTWNPPVTANAAYSYESIVISEPGAVVVGVRQPAPGLACGGFACHYFHRLVTTNTATTQRVELQFLNGSGGTVDPPSGTWTVLYVVP